MPHLTFRVSDAEAADLETLMKKRGKARSKVLRDLVVEEAGRADGGRGVSKVAGKRELLEVLSERARAGNVMACRLLLEKPWEKAKEPEVVDDDFAALDELAVRRRAS